VIITDHAAAEDDPDIDAGGACSGAVPTGSCAAEGASELFSRTGLRCGGHTARLPDDCRQAALRRMLQSAHPGFRITQTTTDAPSPDAHMAYPFSATRSRCLRRTARRLRRRAVRSRSGVEKPVANGAVPWTFGMRSSRRSGANSRHAFSARPCRIIWMGRAAR
jgi:hypothetical protein